jgi:hypothetical protein
MCTTRYHHALCSYRKVVLDCILACIRQLRGLMLLTSCAYFLCLQGPHDRGMRFLLRTTLNWGSGGDCPALEEVVEGGVC